MITGKYKELYNQLHKMIPGERLLHDSLSSLAFGTDASFYRLNPKLVVLAHSEEEVIHVTKCANQLSIPITFRAAGTSLAGQAISDSVLVIASHGWHNHKVLENGAKIKLGAGIRGARANQFLSKYGRKIGPDPASIDSAMIGGIVANNASGMCSGTIENTYNTLADIRVILADGTLLDTSDPQSVSSFRQSHSQLLASLESVAQEVEANTTLKQKITDKYKIKNTTGYSINSYVDYKDGIDILKHLFIGSEGTLGFISEVTLNTVVEHPLKADALIIYPNIESACNAVKLLKEEPVWAAELMDRAALRSVESAKGVPLYIKDLGEQACALLIESRAETEEKLEKNIAKIIESIAGIETELPISFTKEPKEQALFWKIRKEIFPTVAGMRKVGSTPLIEDICFSVPQLAEATLKLQELLKRFEYNDSVIYGHALEGNLHFVINQDFGTQKEVERYSNFMDEVASLVVNDYNGSLKAEHGTGRNMAPYIKMEWGEDAYRVMQKTKEIFDPKGVLNPGVILNDDPKIHLKNLKPMPATRETVDKCMECGFCEGVCVSEGFTLSPRQRITTFREMERLRKSGEEPHRLAEMAKLYSYKGLDTCATDSLCYVKCPLKVDTGKLVKELRHESNSPRAEKVALKIATNMDKVTSTMRFGLSSLYYLRLLTGKRLFGGVATSLNKISGGIVPAWNEHFPKGAPSIKQSNQPSVSTNTNKVVYFPSCITRSMGTSKDYSKEVAVTQMTEIVLKRAGFEIVYPKDVNSLCCGMAFSSKGFVKAGEMASQKLEKALYEASEGGKYPILCDMSPCLYTMHSNMGERLKLYEPAEFIHKYVLDKLNIKKVNKKVAVFAVCSAKKMEVDKYLYEIAQKCAREVVIIDSNCCGFAGDRGFLLPELNKHGLRNLKLQSSDCDKGYATSRTCEIGLSLHSGITFNSILYLVEEASAQQ